MPTSLLRLSGQQFSDFNFTPLGGFGPGTYLLIDAGSVNGSLGAGTSGTINGLPASLAVQGNDLVLTVVPEPGTLALLVVGAIGALSYAWLRRCSHSGWSLVNASTLRRHVMLGEVRDSKVVKRRIFGLAATVS
jgi:hypothetical protein